MNALVRRTVWATVFVAFGVAAQAARQAPPAQPNPEPAQEKPKNQAKVMLPAGTRLPLVLHNSISTRSAKPGDPVYLETLFPIVQENRVVIPAGSYVTGEVVEAKRAGKVKGRAELMIRLNTMILPNAYAIDFNAIPTGSPGTGGNESVEGEGKIKGDTDKSSDLTIVTTTTMAGLALGTAIGRSGTGAGIGAGAGAAVGVLGVLLSRGPEAVLPRGTTLDVMLDRPLYLDADKVQFTDPGRASVLPGAPNREPVRRRFPF